MGVCDDDAMGVVVAVEGGLEKMNFITSEDKRLELRSSMFGGIYS